ncbi:MAG: heme NO-binding protein [Rhodobacteraceae bacterium PARR1]|nr:MAG: heme NO-binding protein [Rhodobacteraceae bacterium PARR1]
MHGLILRAIQCFLRDIWGAAFWQAIMADLRLPSQGFEAMLTYAPDLGTAVLDRAAARLNRSRDSLLEDMGTYLVSHPRRDGVRRLLRFGGPGFVDFLHSLDHLPGRVRLAVPDLVLPALHVAVLGPDRFRLTVGVAGDALATPMAPLLVGLIRAMADDHGALVMIEAEGHDTTQPLSCQGAAIRIDVLDGHHALARDFRLATPA